MIRITRGKTKFDWRRAYKIYIDGIHCGDIRDYETKEFEVEAGVHTVYAKIDWGRSNKLSVNVHNSVVELEVGGTMDKASIWWGWGALFMGLVYGTFLSHKYLWLREKDAVDAPPGDVE